MQVGIVAFLGMKEAPGRSAVKPWKDSPENVLSRRGLNKGKGIKAIFTMSNHSENMTNRMGSTKRRSERWFHLKRSYGKKIWKFFCQGPIYNESIFNQGPE